jgi:flagellar hook-associated protein 2
MDVSRAANSGLTDVISGVTLNLSADASGKTANLTIAGSTDKAVGLMNTLVSSFNAAFTHLSQKLTSTTSTDSATGKTKYTRGALSGDTTMSSLRNDLSYRMNRIYSNSGSFKRLSEIGISFDKDQKMVIDSTKFVDAIKNHSSDLTALMDASLGEVNTMLAQYSGTSGMLAGSLKSIDLTRTQIDNRITKYNASLTVRKQALFNQYLGYQSQLADYGYEGQLLDLMLGTSITSSTGTTVNTSG